MAKRDYSSKRSEWSQRMSKTIVLPQLYRPLWGAVSVNHNRSPFLGPPSEWDLLGTDALLITEKEEKVLIGERFRKEKYERFGDITLRWRSSMTGDVLEAHSLNCQYFIYAYVNEDKKVLGSWWIVYPNKFLEGIRSGALSGKECKNFEEGGSVFMAFNPRNLEREGCIYKNGKGRLDIKREELVSLPVKTGVPIKKITVPTQMRLDGFR